jgi:hypothetical protein
MAEPSGTTGKRIETMNKSEAVSRPVPADSRTNTASITGAKKNVQTISTQKTTMPTLTTPLGSSKPVPLTQKVINEKKGQNSVPIMQNSSSGRIKNIESSSSMSSSKLEVKKEPTIQTKGQTNGGNDRVTVDKKPNKPLIPESRSSSNIRNPGNTKVDNRVVSSQNPTMASTIKKIDTKLLTVAAINRQQPPTSSPSSSSNPVLTKKTLAANPSSSNASNMNQVTSASNSDMDESMISLGDEEVQRKRAPLTEKYSPYISHSDTSLGDARRRLQIALDQTRQLRAAFTERVYGKYRVCLQPPPQTQDIVKTLKDDPSGMHRKLELEVKRITDEKNAEKRESQKINSSEVVASPPPPTSANVPAGSNTTAAASIGAPNNNNNNNTAASATSNADNTEQYLYVTSGLSLIVLPEDDIADIDMSMYRDRAPINPKTSQRVRGISAAAATSGKLMLERARQGKVARADREKRLQQKVGHQAHNFFDSNYYSRSSQLNTIGTAVTTTVKQSPPTTARNPPSASQKTKPKALPSRSRGSQKAGEGRRTTGAKRAVAPKTSTKVPAGQTAAGAKAIRARVQTPMTVQTLLNLNPIHEELRTDTKYSAATLAMMERGVGTFQGPTTQYHKNTPHRFKHPFPDSLGGRRRPVTSAGGVADSSNAKNLQLTLPPIPSVKECRRHKKITVLPRIEAGTTRATLSIRKILDQFTPSANKAAVAVESIVTQENPLLGRPKKHRKISEIGFVRGLYLDSLEEGRARMGVITTNANQGAEGMKNDDVGIDSTLTLNVLKAVGLIKSSVSNDSKSEKSYFQTSLATSLFKEIPPTDAGPYSDSISKLKDLEQKLSTQKRSFTAAFYSDTESRSVIQSTEEKNHDLKVDIQPKASVPLSLRGGGSGSTNDGKESIKNPEKKPDTSGTVAKNSKNGKSPKRQMSVPKNPTMSAAATQANMMRQNMIREERLQQQRLASLQAQGVAQQHSAQLQAQLQSADHYRQTNALQLAHQLRLSRLQAHGHSGAGDLSDYIGGLHRSPQAQAAYGWSQVSAAAAVANSNNFAALGLNPTGVMPLTVENRTRVLLAREQQNLAACVAAAQRQQAVALMRGMSVVDTQFAQSGYPHMSGHLLNPTTAALIARQGLQNRAITTSPKKTALDHKTASQKAKPELKNLQNNIVAERDALKTQSSQKNEKKAQHNLNTANQNRTNDEKADAGGASVSVDKKRKNSVINGKAVVQVEKRSCTQSVGKNDDRSNPVTLSTTNVPKSSSAGTKSKASEKKIVRDKTYEGVKTKRSDAIQVQNKKTLTKKEDLPSTPLGTDRKSETQKNNAAKTPAGLQYYVPEAPPGISTDFATVVLAGRCHEAIGVSVYRDLACEGLRVVNYITSVGMAVPIPKTVVMNPLKDRMNGLVFKNSNVGSMPASSRDIIAAVILLWLWRNQEGCFQRAFAKSGRIDVDPECKWFVNAAVNKAVTAISNEVIGSTSRANGLTTALLAHKSKSSSGQKGTNGKAEQDSLKIATTKIDLLAASVVSKSLNMTLVLNEDMVRRAWRMIFMIFHCQNNNYDLHSFLFCFLELCHSTIQQPRRLSR